MSNQATMNVTVTKMDKHTWRVEGERSAVVVAQRDSCDPWFNYYVLESMESERVLFSFDDHDSFEDDYALNKALEWAKKYAMREFEADEYAASILYSDEPSEEGPFGGAFASWNDYYRYIGAI